MNKGLPTALSDVLVKLEVLSMIRLNVKLNVHDMSFANADSSLDSLRRYTNRESRHRLVPFLTTLIDQTLNMVSHF